MSKETLIVNNLDVYSRQVQGTQLKILDNISFVINRNEILGLVGETGAGKSVLINAIGCNLPPPLWAKADRLLFGNQQADLLRMDQEELRKIWGKEIAFIPPNARDRLNPILTVGEQVTNIIKANLGFNTEDASRKVIEMFEKVQMPDPERNFNNYPHELSGGMAQRVLVSIALSLSPRLLLADEPTMGLDVTIQTQVLDLMADLLKELQSSVILATRDLGIVANYCTKVAVLCNGQLVEFAKVRDLFKNAMHPYTRHLLVMAFASHRKAVTEADLESVSAKGEIVEVRSETGCRFANRCPLAKEVCRSVTPPERIITHDHYVRCHGLESS